MVVGCRRSNGSDLLLFFQTVAIPRYIKGLSQMKVRRRPYSGGLHSNTRELGETCPTNEEVHLNIIRGTSVSELSLT